MRFTLKAPASATRSPLMTDTGIGTSCTASSTRRAVTTTDSVSRDGDITMSAFTSPPATVTVWAGASKPSSAAETRYEPALSVLVVYTPSPLVIVSTLERVDSLVTVIVTPGSAPPLTSFTTPVRTPGTPWAPAGAPFSRAATNAAAITNLDNIHASPGFGTIVSGTIDQP